MIIYINISILIVLILKIGEEFYFGIIVNEKMTLKEFNYNLPKTAIKSNKINYYQKLLKILITKILVYRSSHLFFDTI